MTEINEVLCEIEYHIKNVKKWIKDIKVKNTFQTYKCNCFIRYKPKRRVLLIVPFNYPFNLCFMPLIGAISADNKVLINFHLKHQTSMLLSIRLLKQVFHLNMWHVLKTNYLKNMRICMNMNLTLFFLLVAQK